jgi:hypothetical protein
VYASENRRHYTTLLCAVAMSLSPLIAPGIQPPAANALPASLRDHVNNDRFQVVTSLRGLPLGVRDGLQALFRSSFLDIAEPGAAFRATDVVNDPKLSTRRLVHAACSTDHCVVYYERGGIAHTWQVAIFHWTPDATRFEWGGVAPGGLRTIAEVRNVILAGAMKPPSSW